MMYRPIFALFLFAQSLLLTAQTTPQDTIAVDFSTIAEPGGLRFLPILPALPPAIAGGREPYFTCFWEFGDGSHRSDEDTPLHNYAQPGTYEAALTATLHYDDGKSPRRKKKKVVVNTATAIVGSWPGVFESKGQPIALANNREPRPHEEMTMVMSYRNLSNTTTDGNIYLFFNEKAFKSKHFNFSDARTHSGERTEIKVSQTEKCSDRQRWWENDGLAQVAVEAGGEMEILPPFSVGEQLVDAAHKTYRDEQSWSFTQLRAGESRNVYITLDATSNMLRDTTAMVHIQAVFVPDNPMVPAEQYTLEMQIVGSHDPNLIAVSDQKINYRHLQKEALTYKVRFQNNGEGPAKRIQLAVDIPKGLNAAQMKPVDWYPKCPICPETPFSGSCLDTTITDDQLIFTFNNVYLPGSNQGDIGDKDSTKGFVRYRIVPAKQMPKQAFSSRASIVFDKNPPVVTNRSQTRFRVGASPGLKIGYGGHPDSIRAGYSIFGMSLSPYKSWRAYPQIEVLTGIQGEKKLPESSVSTIDTFDIARILTSGSVTKLDSFVEQITIFGGESRYYSLEIPFLLRKNMTKWLGLGLGGSARVIWQSGNRIQEINLTSTVKNQPGEVIEMKTNQQKLLTPFQSRTIRYTAFGDITVGAVRAGPNIGIRGGAQFGGDKIVPFVQLSVELRL